MARVGKCAALRPSSAKRCAALYCADTDEQVYRAIRAGVSMITGNNPEHALRILRQQGLHK